MIDLALDIQHSPGAVLISPRLESAQSQPLDYRLSVTRGDDSGQSTINQQGAIQAGVAPSSIRLSLGPGASCQVLFEVRQGATLLATLQRSCSASEEGADQQSQP